MEIARAARRNRDFAALIEALPYARFLGVEARIDEVGLTTRLPFRERNLGNPELPALHGGVIGGFLELAAAFELIWGLDDAVLPKTINVTIDYLRSAGPRDCSARGSITKLGRRVANVRVEAWQERPERPIAQGHVHFLLGQRRA